MKQAIYYVEQINKDNKLTVKKIPKKAINIPLHTAQPNETLKNDDNKKIINKQTLLKGLAKACDFPSYFTNNWDSAYDCLTDSHITHLTLDLTHADAINTEDLNAFRSIIEDAYSQFGKPQLWIIVPREDE